MKTTFVRHVAFALLALVVVRVLVTEASAQSVRYAGSHGPIVLRVDPDSGYPVPPPAYYDVRVERAVPVPSVMNGSGFGLTGTDYYSDGLHEGPLRRGIRVREFVLAPALRVPPQR